jgi:hypothetical protein
MYVHANIQALALERRIIFRDERFAPMPRTSAGCHVHGARVEHHGGRALYALRKGRAGNRIITCDGLVPDGHEGWTRRGEWSLVTMAEHQTHARSEGCEQSKGA